MIRRRPHRLTVLLAIAALAASCATDRHKRRDEPAEPEPRPTYIQRTGVPFLMDLPLVGVLFRQTTVVR